MTTERKPHKWAEVIKAWADGKPIQFRIKNGAFWIDIEFDGGIPLFNDPMREFRLKPENIVIEGCITRNPYFDHGCFSIKAGSDNNIRLEFDPDTYKLVKAEVIGNE